MPSLVFSDPVGHLHTLYRKICFLERRTWRGTETITIAKQTIRGEAFDLVARCDPAGRALNSGA